MVGDLVAGIRLVPMTKAEQGIAQTHSDRLAALAERSIEIILANQASTGAYVASPNFRVYRYSWLRDGAFIADAMGRAGHIESASSFFHWCRRVVEGQTDRIDDLVRRHQVGDTIKEHEYLHTRYTIDGDEAHDEWWNHQLDGYGAWLWGLGDHLRRLTRADEAERFAPAVDATARYLTAFWDRPCYDCWEENGDQIHVATLAAVAAGLRVAAEWPGVSSEVQSAAEAAVAAIEARVRDQGTMNGHLVKWLGGRDIDASLLFCAIPYRLFIPNDPLMQATVAELFRQLVHDGIHRHSDDTFFGGGEWVLLTALLGSYQVAVGDRDGARSKLQWTAGQVTDDGWLPEQVSAHLLHPECFDEWEQRWGPVATPLLWSHAMYLNLYRELYPPK